MLRDKIKDDAVIALKAGEKRKVEVLRFLISLIDKKELELPVGSLTEEVVLGVLQKELKHKEESKAMFVAGNRTDLVAEVEEEMGILKSYLPAEMSQDEVKQVVMTVVAEKGKNFGMVMGETMKRLAGRVSGDKVAAIVKECLM